MKKDDIGFPLMKSPSDEPPPNPDLPTPPVAVRPRPKTKNCCPTYRRLQTVNALVLLMSAFMIAWYLKDLIVDHFDRETSNYLGLGAGGFYFGLGLYACWYSHQIQKKTLAEEAKALLEFDDEEQGQVSVADSKVNVFAGNPSSPVSDAKNNDKNNTTIDIGQG
jgi:cbb3-type cytochrome oxidase subunit 3